MRYDAVVIGAGAAGLMCAIEAGRRGRRVVVVEHNRDPGRKILISGGGRCNFTNRHCRPENFLSSNPHFAKSALARYTPDDFLRLVGRHRVRWQEKKLGQLFCDDSARDILNLLRGVPGGGSPLGARRQVLGVRKTTEYVVDTASGRLAAPALVVATGGLSIPKIGATGLGYDIARQFGLRIVPCYPALVPLAFGAEDQRRFNGLAGVSAEAVAACGRQSFRERLLFTHRGLSGPAILQISSYWHSGKTVTIDLVPGADFSAELLARKRAGDRATLAMVLREKLPQRLADRWVEYSGARGPLGAIGDRKLADFGAQLNRWEFHPAGTEGYEKAEVTAGGVHPDDLSAQTMAAREVPGLYFVGEVVDVTGHLGGFNFQWAWASGWVAGQAL